VIVLAGFTFLGLNNYWTGNNIVKRDRFYETVSKNQMEKISIGIKAYYGIKDVFPDKLDTLSEKYLILKEDLTYPYKDGYYYKNEGNNYILLDKNL